MTVDELIQQLNEIKEMSPLAGRSNILVNGKTIIEVKFYSKGNFYYGGHIYTDIKI